MDLLRRFQRTLRAIPVESGDTMLVAVSGGADSLTLLHLFVHSRGELGITPVAAHVNHRIRGPESDADERFVAAIAEQWQVPFRVERIDVPALAQARKLTLEEAARKARYTSLSKAAGEAGAKFIAVAHNADDQAETVLLHLLRGSGLAGLRGMLPVTPLSPHHLLESATSDSNPPLHIIRPLLDIPRADIDAYLAEHGLQPRLDSTNLDTGYLRNRLRHEILPLLEQVNLNLRAALGRTASLLAADYDVLQQQVSGAWKAVCLEETFERVRFDREAWRESPLAIRREMIRQAARRLLSDQYDLGFEHVEAAVRIAQEGETGALVTLPAGLILALNHHDIAIFFAGHYESCPEASSWPLLDPAAQIEISRPGVYSIPESSWQFELAVYGGPREGPPWDVLLADPWSAVLDADALTLPAALRTRRPGDRFYPQGAGGSQKLSNFMTNSKIPSLLRGLLPLLVSGDAIAWVCGWRVDQRFIVREETQRVWLAQFEKIE